MDKIWLVKKENQIYGPINQEQLCQMATYGFLTKTDEVTKPLRKWIFAGQLDHPMLFKKENLVQTISFSLSNSLNKFRESSLSEKSQSQRERDFHHPSQKKNQILDKNQDTTNSEQSKKNVNHLNGSEFLNTDHLDDSKERSVNSFSTYSCEAIDIHSLRHVPVMKPLTQLAEDTPYAIKKKKTHSKSFLSHFSDSHSEKKKDVLSSLSSIKIKNETKAKKIMNVFWLMLVAGLGVGLFFYQHQQHLQKKIQQNQLLDNVVDFRKAFQDGDYQQALSLSKESALVSSKDYMHLSVLLLQLENNVYESKIALQKSKNNPSYNRARGFLLEGMIAFRENRNQDAEKFFNLSKSTMNSDFLPLFYQSLLLIQDQQLDKAHILLSQLDDSNITHKNLILFLKSISDLRHSIEYSMTLINQMENYSQESLLVFLYRSFLENPSQISKRVQMVLNQDPYITSEYHYDIFLTLPNQIWSSVLMKPCSEIYQSDTENPYVSALYFFCQAQSGQMIVAQQNMQRLVSRFSKDSLILSVYSYILYQRGEVQKSLFQLSKAIQYNQNQWKLPFILKSRFCANQNNFKCSDLYWNKIKKYHQPKSLAILQKAILLQSLGRNQEAFLQIQSQARNYPDYLPFQKFLSQ